ncbi:hypothetical protein [Amycolatopsis pigmentata]|uniref:Uncharacterized protein n=1 Tax=Amycolatopsis pigmentata TaxID=450801 RepID=A0ABW5G738_9PSEU
MISHAGHVLEEPEAIHPSKEIHVGRAVDIAVQSLDSSTVEDEQTEDSYAHPTVRSLATALDAVAPATATPPEPAKIGKDATIFSRNVPVCTDLLTIGDRTVIREDAFFPGYRAVSGVIRTGTVTLGKGVFVGETPHEHRSGNPARKT